MYYYYYLDKSNSNEGGQKRSTRSFCQCKVDKRDIDEETNKSLSTFLCFFTLIFSSKMKLDLFDNLVFRPLKFSKAFTVLVSRFLGSDIFDLLGLKTNTNFYYSQ